MFRAVWNGAVLAETDRTVTEGNHYFPPESLHRARLPVEEINIWEDPAAAAQVRHIIGGDETVPVVVVGTRAMVNPTARQVVAAVRAGQPGLFLAQGHRPGSWLARATGFLPGRRLRPGHAAREPSRHRPAGWPVTRWDRRARSGRAGR